MIIQDIFVEMKETFEVMLLPNPNNLLGAIIQPGKDRAVVTISDGQLNRSMCIYIYTLNVTCAIHVELSSEQTQAAVTLNNTPISFLKSQYQL